MKGIKNILNSGAPSKAIARELNEKGYRYITFGWDCIENGIYFRYNNDTQSFEDNGYPCELSSASECENLQDFQYTNLIKGSDVLTLKKLYL